MKHCLDYEYHIKRQLVYQKVPNGRLVHEEGVNRLAANMLKVKWWTVDAYLFPEVESNALVSICILNNMFEALMSINALL